MKNEKTNGKASQGEGTTTEKEKKAVKNVALFADKNTSLKENEIDSVFDSGVFESGEAVDLSSKVLGKEFWEEREGQELKCIFTGIKPFASDFHGGKEIDSAELIIEEGKGGKRITCIAPSNMLVSSLRRGGIGAYLITYLGIEEGKKYSYQNFQVKLLRNFK